MQSVDHGDNRFEFIHEGLCESDVGGAMNIKVEGEGADIGGLSALN